MKKYILIASAALVMSACNQAKIDKTELDRIRQKDSIMALVNSRDASINDFIISFNEVERNLDSVTARQHLIALHTGNRGDLKPSQRARINEGIAAINTLMDENRKNLAVLKRKLKNSSYKNVQLEKAIAIINNQLAQKDVELTALNEKLNQLTTQVAELQTSLAIATEENNQKAIIIADETAALHTAYYVVGKSKELREAKLIVRRGGLLGIGKTPQLNADIDKTKFTRIDYTQTTTIPINSSMKIITEHPSDSYVLDKDARHKKEVTNLTITNPEKFWSSSKYLVVLKN